MIPVAEVYYNSNLSFNTVLNAWNVSTRMGTDVLDVRRYDGEQWVREYIGDTLDVPLKRVRYFGYLREELEYIAGHYLDTVPHKRHPSGLSSLNSVIFMLKAIKHWQDTMGDPPIAEMCEHFGIKRNADMVLSFIYVALTENRK